MPDIIVPQCSPGRPNSYGRVEGGARQARRERAERVSAKPVTIRVDHR